MRNRGAVPGTKSTLLELERPESPGFVGDEKRAAFEIDIPFSHKAIGSKGDLELRGYASTWVEDRDGEYVDRNAFDNTLEEYFKNPMILFQHDMDKPIGKMTEAAPDEYGLNIVGLVAKPDPKEPDWAHLAYSKISKGILKTLSIGGFFTREFVMGRSVIKEIELMEVSVVSIPSNPDSIFEAAVKAIKGSPRRPKLLQGHIAQMKQILGVEPLSSPELIVMTPAERVERYELIADAYLKAGLRAPELDEWKLLAPKVHAAKGDEILEITPQLTGFIRKVNGGVIEEKRGRILSGSNEQKLRDVGELMDGAEKQIDEWASAGKKMVTEMRSELNVVLKQVAAEDETDDPDPDPAEEDADKDDPDEAAETAETAEEDEGSTD